MLLGARAATRPARAVTGPLAWFLGQLVVEFRDLVVYRLQGRKKHPKNVYS